MLKYCLVIYSPLYLNVVIRISFYIRLQFYFEDEKCHVLNYSAITHVIHSLHNLYLRSSKLDTLHMCIWILLLLWQLHFCRELTESIKTMWSTCVLTADTSREFILPPEERRNPASQQNRIYPFLGEGHRLGRLKRPFSKNKQREIWPSVLISDEQMVFGIVIVTAEYHYLLSPPERECERHHLSTRRFWSWTGTVSCETLSCEPQPSLHNSEYLWLF